MVRTSLLSLVVALLLGSGLHAQDEQANVVKVTLKKGIDAMRSGNTEQSIKHLERVVRLKPRVAHYRYLLAGALLQAKRGSDAWKQLRIAVRLDPSHHQAVDAFQRMWNGLDGAGALNAGKSAAELKRFAGAPDAKTGRNGDGQWLYGFMAVEMRGGRVYRVIDTRVMPRLPAPAATWKFDLDRTKWKVGHRSADRSNAVAEWVHGGETVQNWTELFSLQRLLFLGKRRVSARDMLGKIEKNLQRVSPNARIKVLKDGDTDLVYTWSIPNVEGHAAQHEIARLVVGKVDVHRIAYTVRAAEMSKQQRARWLKVISEARLVPVE